MRETRLDPTAPDWLVHRFLDQELTADERVRFLERLDRDAPLRERAIDMAQVVLDASRVPRLDVPETFVARVLDRTAAPPASWRRLAEALWAPRTLHWNLAGATALASLALVVGALVSGGPWRSPVAPDAGAAPGPVLVRLVVVQPGARSVAAAGDFNGWNPDRTPLEPLAGGAWTVMIPLEPGRYEYMFVVDGQEWIADPFAAEQADDGFGSRNAVIDVRPPAGRAL